LITCAKCGTQYEGQFCSACGTPAANVAPPAVPASAAGLEPNIAAMLCYSLGIITGIIFLVLAPYNTNKATRFHAFQSIFMSASVIALQIVMSTILPFGLLLILSPLVSLGALGLWLFMLIKSYQGAKVVLPVIGPLAEQQA
jgi:uncharacterized membrane protein